MASTNRSLALLSSMLNTPTPLPNIRRLTCTVAQRGPHQASLRAFIRTRLPVLRFHNPQMAVVIDKQRANTGQVRAQVAVECVDGSSVVVDALETGWDSEIFRRVVEIGQKRSGGGSGGGSAASTATATTSTAKSATT